VTPGFAHSAPGGDASDKSTAVRNGICVAFISKLMDSGVEFVAADMPHANRLTVHILAAVAEHEREAISTRTKAALTAAKPRGRAWGSEDCNGARPWLGGNKDAADRFAANVVPVIRQIQASVLLHCEPWPRR
jgi:DNA invertase Pin-like site-specific DNA recombinase